MNKTNKLQQKLVHIKDLKLQKLATQITHLKTQTSS